MKEGWMIFMVFNLFLHNSCYLGQLPHPVAFPARMSKIFKTFWFNYQPFEIVNGYLITTLTGTLRKWKYFRTKTHSLRCTVFEYHLEMHKKEGSLYNPSTGAWKRDQRSQGRTMKHHKTYWSYSRTQNGINNNNECFQESIENLAGRTHSTFSFEKYCEKL